MKNEFGVRRIRGAVESPRTGRLAQMRRRFNINFNEEVAAAVDIFLKIKRLKYGSGAVSPPPG
jgi:hypothetical protein